MRTDHVLNTLDDLIDQIDELRSSILWQKASPPCPPNDVKPSLNAEPNVSTTSNSPINTIQLQVPKQHRNATLVLRQNQLTKRHELVYTWEDATTHLKSEEVLTGDWLNNHQYPNPLYFPQQPFTLY